MFIVHFGLSLWLPLSFTTSLILQVVRGVQAPQLTSWVDTASSFLFPILFVFPPVVPSQVSNTVFLFAVTKKKNSYFLFLASAFLVASSTSQLVTLSAVFLVFLIRFLSRLLPTERTAPACRMQTAVTVVIRGGGELLSVKSVLSQSASPPTLAGSALL